MKANPISALQTEYSLWTRDVEAEILPTCRELGIGFVAYRPLGRGFLSAKFKKSGDLPPGDGAVTRRGSRKTISCATGNWWSGLNRWPCGRNARRRNSLWAGCLPRAAISSRYPPPNGGNIRVYAVKLSGCYSHSLPFNCSATSLASVNCLRMSLKLKLRAPHIPPGVVFV